MRNKNIRLQLIILIVGIFLLTGKFLAWYFTHSNTILTDALESIVNVVAGAFTLFSLWLASKPRDEEHPYGHGKIEFISAGFEGAMIVLAGLLILGKSSYNLVYPVYIHDLDIGMYFSMVTGGINYVAGFALVKSGRKARSLAMESSGEHLKSDAYTSVGMIVGLAIVFFTDQLWLDSVVAIIMACLIVYMGFKIVRKSLAGIMDEADKKVILEILEILNRNRSVKWIDVHNLRVIKFGDVYHVDCHVTLPWYYDIRQAHDEMDAITNLVEKEINSEVEFFIHTDPCVSESCEICSIENCAARKNKFVKRTDWNFGTLISNAKHKL